MGAPVKASHFLYTHHGGISPQKKGSLGSPLLQQKIYMMIVAYYKTITNICANNTLKNIVKGYTVE